MSTVEQKKQFLTQVQSAMTEIAQLNERFRVLTELYTARAYAENAADPITASDLNSFGVAPYDVGVAINIGQALNTLCAGQAVAANAATPNVISKWRTI